MLFLLVVWRRKTGEVVTVHVVRERRRRKKKER